LDRKSLIKTKPLFPIEYGFTIRELRRAFDEMSTRGFKIKQVDVMRVFNILSTLEEFISFLIKENIDIDYDDEKQDIMDSFDKQMTLYGQIQLMKKWFGLINRVVGRMYFDIAGVDTYESNTGSYQDQPG
jgi:hypothetical protein